MPFDAAGTPEIIVFGILEEADAGGKFVHAGLFGGGREGAGFQEKIVGVFVEFAEGVFFRAFHAEGVIVAVGLAECAVVEEIVAHPDVDHGSLR